MFPVYFEKAIGQAQPVGACEMKKRNLQNRIWAFLLALLLLLALCPACLAESGTDAADGE